MFTGLIQQVGRIASISTSAGGGIVSIRHAPWDAGLAPGESVAVDGACLTVEAQSESLFRADLLDETCRRTALGWARVGDSVNLERAMTAADRLGGHFVTGHIDGVGRVESVRTARRDRVLRVACAADLLADIVCKGSVAVQGVSLTVAGVDERGFEVHLVPATRQNTTLGGIGAGSQVNLETDIMAKYVRRATKGHPTALTHERLREAGYI
jgi:riboflavin synthase